MTSDNILCLTLNLTLTLGLKPSLYVSLKRLNIYCKNESHLFGVLINML